MTDLARRLRKTSTDAERALWHRPRAGQLDGLKFRRQHPLGPYIVDFVCLDKAVVVEVDGGQHAEEEQKGKDRIRDQWLESEEFAVVRFWDGEVLVNTEGVLEVIRQSCLDHPPVTCALEGGE